MRIIQLWLTLFSIFLLPFTGSAQEKNTCLSGHLPDYPLPKGISAPPARIHRRLAYRSRRV